MIKSAMNRQKTGHSLFIFADYV